MKMADSIPVHNAATSSPAKPEDHYVTDDTIASPGHGHGHNPSMQHNVESNPDLALHISREHEHAHLHHNKASEKGRKESVTYSKDTTYERSSIPDQNPQEHDLHRRHHPEKGGGVVEEDPEKGKISPTKMSEEEDPKSHKFSHFYAKYRIFFHLFIWLLFTGYVHHFFPFWPRVAKFEGNISSAGGLQASSFTDTIWVGSFRSCSGSP